jgi:ankyrin repeat protein
MGVNAKDSTGRTLLLLAAGNGHTEVVILLLDKGADQDMYYIKTLWAGSREGQQKIVQKLLKSKTDQSVMNSERPSPLCYIL